ncbi:MAG UNVERIFIED_CONTAM: hypothetical protein LVT10_14750 [Anaerolineae bacterium]
MVALVEFCPCRSTKEAVQVWDEEDSAVCLIQPGTHCFMVAVEQGGFIHLYEAIRP